MNLAVFAGLTGIFGAVIYAVGDVFLLAGQAGASGISRPLHIDTERFPELKQRVPLFETLAKFSSRRLAWGGLLGVFAAPLNLAGIWQVAQALEPAGSWLTLPPVLLFAYSTVIGSFIHGSFTHIGETLHALADAHDAARSAVMETLARQHRVVVTAYLVLFICSIIGSFWFAVAVISGKTAYPLVMAAINPVTATLAWLLLKAILPNFVGRYTEGAGFNIAQIVFFGASTILASS
jgi:uncharacterized protein DUF6796